MAKKQPSSTYEYERIPEASQLLILPFVSAIAGLFEECFPKVEYRITMHRTIARENLIYLQQITDYISSNTRRQNGSGRIFAVDTGIMGAALQEKAIYRTKEYASKDALLADLKSDMVATNDTRDIKDVAKSYLVIPFLRGEQNGGTLDYPPLILYADAFKENVFANDQLVKQILAASRKFCASLDHLVKEPLTYIKNYPLDMENAVPVEMGRSKYPTIQEIFLPGISPVLNQISSFNFEFD